MIKNIILLLIISSIATTAMAQTVSGIVKDSTSTPIAYATVVLSDATDTAMIDYAITDSSGGFSLNHKVRNGLLLHVSFVGYKPKYQTARAEQTIILEQDGFQMGEITLVTTRPISKITAEGMQTDVAHTVLAEMGTGNDVLKRIPMLSGDDGEYEVFGRGKAKIYINGREVRDPAELDRLNSTDIQNVEVVTNPGARYDATVAAVINITTTKKQGDGFSINARSSFYTWETQDYVEQISANYRKGGLDIFANINYTNSTGTQKGEMTQTVSVDTLWHQDAYIDAIYNTNYLYGTLGLSYEINKNHSVGVQYDLATQAQDNLMDFNTTTTVYADNVEFDKWVNNSKQESNVKPQSQVNVYYAGKIEKLSIDFNADYLKSGYASKDENKEISEAFGERTIRSTSSFDNALWAAKLQLAYPIWKGKLMLGSEYVNISRTDEYINNDLPDFTSRVDVAEQNVAAFVQYQASTKGGDFSLGLRYENASYEYYSDGVLSDDMSKTYNQWFPSASYSINIDKVSLQLAYTSKVQRPSYNQLSNNILYANRFTMQKGNPYLKPAINHNVAFTGVWKFIQASVSYNHSVNEIVMWTELYEKDPKVAIFTSRNIDIAPSLTAYIAIAPTIKFWQPQWTVGLKKHWIDMSDYGLEPRENNPFFIVNWKNTFDLPHDIIINLDASFSSKGHYLFTYLYKSTTIVDFAIAKSFLNKSLQIKLGINDIFNQNLNFGQSVYPQSTFTQNFEHDRREAYITLRYSFNQTQSKYKGSSAGQDAKNRL